MPGPTNTYNTHNKLNAPAPQNKHITENQREESDSLLFGAQQQSSPIATSVHHDTGGAEVLKSDRVFNLTSLKNLRARPNKDWLSDIKTIIDSRKPSKATCNKLDSFVDQVQRGMNAGNSTICVPPDISDDFLSLVPIIICLCNHSPESLSSPKKLNYFRHTNFTEHAQDLHNFLKQFDSLSHIKVPQELVHLKTNLSVKLRIPFSKYRRHFPPVSTAEPAQQFVDEEEQYKTIATKIKAACSETHFQIAEEINSLKNDEEFIRKFFKTYLPEFSSYCGPGRFDYALSYPDDAIVDVYVGSKQKRDNLNFDITEVEGKHVILQQASRSCFPTAVIMLILDNGVEPQDYERLWTTDVAFNEDMKPLAEENGFDLRASSVNSFAELNATIKQNGPVIMDVVDSGVGGHAIIVDKVDLKNSTITIRDPYHGWMVDVKVSKLRENTGICWLMKKPVMPQTSISTPQGSV